jgi:hypothetical protein
MSSKGWELVVIAVTFAISMELFSNCESEKARFHCQEKSAHPELCK